MSVELLSVAIMITTKFIQADPMSKIVDGFTCHPRVYPYLAAVKTINSAIFCGGSLINKYWVVTAGHCCSPHREEQFVVYTGLTRRSYVRRSTVRRRIVHPDFTVMPLSSDICLLELNRPLRENRNIAYTEIANKSTYDTLLKREECNESLVLGFGSQGKLFPNRTELPPDVENPRLQCIYQKVMPESYCSGNALVDESMLCTLSSYHETADVCKGDSGGPLICKGIQIGLVSAGRGCGIGTPSFYTRVDLFYNFIWSYAKADLIHLSAHVLVLNFCVISFIYSMYIS